MLRCLLFFLALILTGPASAQERVVPYWASLRSDEVNMRVGPSENYPIDWVYKRRNLPVKVVRLMQGWRLVRDPEGTQGWVVARLLSPERSAIVIGEGLAAMHEEPSGTSELRWKVEPGVVGMLGECEEGWCLFDVEGRKGWIEQERLWGAGEP
jgi:SH3-like domain-containing protein